MVCVILSVGNRGFYFIVFIVLRTKSEDETINDLKLLLQNLGMLLGIPIIYFRNLFHLPDIKNYKPEMRYGLPFEGRWIIANGGITKEDSHSWNICNQRYAYDFYIQENGKTFCNSGKNVTDYFAMASLFWQQKAEPLWKSKMCLMIHLFRRK